MHKIHGINAIDELLKNKKQKPENKNIFPWRQIFPAETNWEQTAPRRDSSNANELCQPALSDLFINQDIFVETFVCTSEVFHLWIWNLMEVDSQQALALTLAWYVFDLIGVYLDMCLKDICLARWTRREQKPHNTVSFVSAFHWKGKENRNGKQRNSLELSVTWIM